MNLLRRSLLGVLGAALAAAALVLSGRAVDLVAIVRRAFVGMALLAVLVSAAVAGANELTAAPAPASGLVIHDAAETLRDWCETDAAGVLWLKLPGGSRWELVASTADPAIANPGDGAFHPFEAAEVRSALESVHYPLAGVSAEIFLLPFPRRSGLESAAAPGLMLLAPGVWPISAEQQHAECDHELGHLVQYLRMPDGDAQAWDRYRRLRGIADVTVYNATAAHADRPHEIFAEDFRALFGDYLATSSGTIENPDLAPPGQVPGLADFLRAVGGGTMAVAISASPNPARNTMVFSRPGAPPAPLDVFDVTGRRIATLDPQGFPGGAQWSWDRRDASGARVGAGVVFARPRDGGAPLRVTLLP